MPSVWRDAEQNLPYCKASLLLGICREHWSKTVIEVCVILDTCKSLIEAAAGLPPDSLFINGEGCRRFPAWAHPPFQSLLFKTTTDA